MAALLCNCIIHYITHIIQTHAPFHTKPQSFYFGHIIFIFKALFYFGEQRGALFSPPLSHSFFPSLPFCGKPHSNPFPSFLPLLFIFCSLSPSSFYKQYFSGAYSNWNLLSLFFFLLCQDKETSASPERYTLKQKFDSSLRSVSITVLLLFQLFFFVVVVVVLPVFPLWPSLDLISLFVSLTQLFKMWEATKPPLWHPQKPPHAVQIKGSF